MKKFVITSILFLALFLNTTNSAFAYKYRVYDPSTNKTYYASIMTLTGLGEDPDEYCLGLYGEGLSGLIIISVNTNKNNAGYIGGEAYRQDGHLYKWRELNQNNYYEEMHSIINERKPEGTHIHPAYIR